MEEEGGLNLSGFVANVPVASFDLNGLTALTDETLGCRHSCADLRGGVFSVLGLPEKRLNFLNCVMAKLFADARNFMGMKNPSKHEWMYPFQSGKYARDLKRDLTKNTTLAEEAFQNYFENRFSQGAKTTLCGGFQDNGYNVFSLGSVINPDAFWNSELFYPLDTLLHEPMHEWRLLNFHMHDVAGQLSEFMLDAVRLARSSRTKTNSMCGSEPNEGRWEEIICACNRSVYGKASHETVLRE
jgi:hypothetical protein